MSEPVLCYEVWQTCDGEPIKMLQAYWDVKEAWKTSIVFEQTSPDIEPIVIVANGRQLDRSTGITSVRSDVK